MNPRPPHDEPTGQVEQQRQWMQSAQRGDRDAFVQLVTSFSDSIFNAILRMVGDAEEARDLTQEMFVKVREKLETYHGECEPYVWFLKCAMNLSISQVRKLQRRRDFSEESNQASSLSRRVDSATDGDGDGEPEHMLRAIAQLDAEYRAILILRDIENLSYEQIADILGIPPNLLQTRLFRARLALHDHLKN